jgi:hydroxypyruvate reductase
MRHLQNGVQKKVPETPKPGALAFENVQNVIIGNNLQAMEAAANHAKGLGYHTCILSSRFEGETKNVAFFHTAVIKEVINSKHPVAPPACILSGGETTVTLTGNGLGGRNQEFALAALQYLEANENFVLLSAGTDGTDGPTDAAGAVIDAETLARSKSNHLDVKGYLKNNDSYHFFKHLGDLLITGPTNTNVMDLRVILVR